MINSERESSSTITNEFNEGMQEMMYSSTKNSNFLFSSATETIKNLESSIHEEDSQISFPNFNKQTITTFELKTFQSSTNLLEDFSSEESIITKTGLIPKMTSKENQETTFSRNSHETSYLYQFTNTDKLFNSFLDPTSIKKFSSNGNFDPEDETSTQTHESQKWYYDNNEFSSQSYTNVLEKQSVSLKSLDTMFIEQSTTNVNQPSLKTNQIINGPTTNAKNNTNIGEFSIALNTSLEAESKMIDTLEETNEAKYSSSIGNKTFESVGEIYESYDLNESYFYKESDLDSIGTISKGGMIAGIVVGVIVIIIIIVLLVYFLVVKKSNTSSLSLDSGSDNQNTFTQTEQITFENTIEVNNELEPIDDEAPDYTYSYEEIGIFNLVNNSQVSK